MGQAKTPEKTSKKGKAKAGIRAVEGGSKIDPERLYLVETLLSECRTQREIVDAVIKRYKVSRSTAYAYYDRVVREWREEEGPKRNYNRFHAIKSLERVFAKAIKAGKYAAAVRAIEVKAKLQNLYEPEEIIIHNEPERDPIDDMTRAQLKAYMLEEQEKAERLLAQAKIPMNGTDSIN